jgi:pimeloyl-ACP methyl ester carboxylesterase
MTPDPIVALVTRTKRLYGTRAHDQIVQLARYHHEQQRADPDATSRVVRDAEFVSARMADRDVPRGEMLLLGRQGVPYVVSRVFARRGAYVVVLERSTEAISKELAISTEPTVSKEPTASPCDVPASFPPGNDAAAADDDDMAPVKIVCRGSAAGRGGIVGFASVANQMMPVMGGLGLRAIWPRLRAYLAERRIPSVELVGKSMGGATAQQLAVLLEGVAGIRVSRLVTVCSIGVGRGVNDLFRERVLSRRTDDDPCYIIIIRNGGAPTKTLADGSPSATPGDPSCVDHVPLVGGVHLGHDTPPARCSISLYYLTPDRTRPAVRERVPATLSLREQLRFFWTSFGAGRAHGRQTTLWDGWGWDRVEDRADVDALLALGESRVETARGVLVVLAGVALWPWGKRFSSYWP